MRTNLRVPFAESEQVKRLGAQWDMGLKKWYVPDGVDLFPFMRWIPNAPTLTREVKKALNHKRKEKYL